MRTSILCKEIGLTIAVLVIVYAAPTTFAQKYSVVHSMPTKDGLFIRAGVILDKDGNLYSTAEDGGPSGLSSAGTVFRVDQAGKLTVLYNFQGRADGGYSEAPVVRDSRGNLYGTTSYDGPGSCPGGVGCGTVFKVDQSGTETVLHGFTGYPDDGWYPFAGLVRDSKGNLYGTTQYGGTSDSGTVFEIVGDGEEMVLHSFSGADGSQPLAGLIRDKEGNLFGTTSGGGTSDAGTIFEIQSNGTFDAIHSFSGSEGASAEATLMLDSEGNLYGTSAAGGASGCGTVFMFGTNGVLTLLHTFTCQADGGFPRSNLVLSKGELLGTAFIGGRYGFGVLFAATKAGEFCILHDFSNNRDGAYPYAGLTSDGKGNLFGTTEMGGIGNGTIYKVTPDPAAQ